MGVPLEPRPQRSCLRGLNCSLEQGGRGRKGRHFVKSASCPHILCLSVCLSPSSLWVWCWVNPGSPPARDRLLSRVGHTRWGPAQPSPAAYFHSARASPLFILFSARLGCRCCKYHNFRLPDWKELQGGEESSLVYSLGASSRLALPPSVCPSSPNCGPIRPPPPLFVFRPDFPEPGEE